MKIKLDSISKYYYSSNAVVPALRKIKLEFDIGEFVAITGESGSGKSTLLNIISGLDTYDDGELYVEGEATSCYDDADWEEYRKNKIGFVFQNYNLIEHYSVLNNVESALLIQGCSSKDAKAAAKELIHRVDLSRQLHQRASRLSSGQKQRLSIARALAKNTDIIIADEPTGNLDSENGRQIMELLSELSKDKLIITVTHNYDEASPYVTRKIRLHDGEVVSDTCVNQGEDISREETDETASGLAAKAQEDGDSSIDISPKVITDDKATESAAGAASRNNRKKSDSRIAWRFTWMNITTQPGRVSLFTIFLMLTAAVTFLFLGRIYSNWDDTFTKESRTEYFFNRDTTRLVVIKPNGSPITAEDIKKFNKIKHVQMADVYDYANDINYFISDGTDYDYIYEENSSPDSRIQIRNVQFLAWDKFMKSTTCITEKDLAAGVLPENRNEAVIYSTDENVLGTELGCFFKCRNGWGYNDYYKTTVKIVGLLKQETKQVYFSEELCSMLSLSMYDNYFNLSACMNILTGSYTINTGIIPVIGDNLGYGDVKASAELAGDNDISGDALVSAYINGEQTVYDAVVLVNYNDSSTRFVEISGEWFNEMYRQKSCQASLYLKDYIYTDYVLGRLKDLGYTAVSPFRVSAGEYDYRLLNERNFTIYMSLAIIFLIALLEIIIVRSIMKIRNKDFMILGSIGMNHSTIKMINFFEMYLYSLASTVTVIAVAYVICLFRFHYVADLMKYYNIFAYAIFLALTLLKITLTVWLFNRYLKHKQRWKV